MRILGVSQALTVLILVIFVLVPFGAAEALKAGDPGWCSGPDRYGIDDDCPRTAYCPHSKCLRCVGGQGTDAGDGGKSVGCEDCGPKLRCTACGKIANCQPNDVMHPSTFKNYKKKPIEPETTPPTPEEKAGVFEQKPHKGIGDILKETQP